MGDNQDYSSIGGQFSYYSNELCSLHLSESNKFVRKVNDNGHPAADDKVAQAIDLGNNALGVIGKVMSLPNQINDAVMMPLMSQLTALQGIACLPAASHLDPILGIDVHLVMIPPSPSPIPMPHPYIAMIMNPKDWIACAAMSAVAFGASLLPMGSDDANVEAGAELAFNAGAMALQYAMAKKGFSATVKFGALRPRAIHGTQNETIPHFPMGTGFAPTPIQKNDGHVQFGSLFVGADCEPFAGFMHFNNDCWDIGLPILRSTKQIKDKDTGEKLKYLYMPTGMILSIPSSMVLVNPVPVPINPQLIVYQMLKAGLGKLLTHLNQKHVSNEKVRDRIQDFLCEHVGEPVNVASGGLFSKGTDFSLPGPIPLSWERRWFSDSNYTGPLGHGWHHSYDLLLELDEASGRAIMQLGNGCIARFRLPAPGKTDFDRKAKMTLHHGPDSYYASDSDGLIYRFTNKLITSITNRNGFSILFQYNRQGRLQQVIDSAGRVLEVVNDPEGRITAIYTARPDDSRARFAIARYEYDEQGNLITQHNALNHAMHYDYENYLLRHLTWRNGANWHFVYEGKGAGAKVIHTWGDGGIMDYKLQYFEGCTIAEDSLGYKTTYYHDGGLVTKKIDPAGGEWEYRHNRFCELEWETDPLGNQRVFTHDEWGNVVSTIEPDGAFTHTEYFMPGFPHLPTEILDPAGGKWMYEYDEAGNLTAVKDPLNRSTHFKYEKGRVSAMVDGTANLTRIDYDRMGNWSRMTFPNGQKIEWEYDSLGRCVHSIDPAGNSQRVRFDLLGQQQVIEEADGNRWKLEYDAEGDILLAQDNHRKISFTYNVLGDLVLREENGSGVQLRYDKEGRLIAVINQEGSTYGYTLDGNGNRIKETGFDGISRTYQRDPAGRVQAMVKGDGTTTCFEYDPAGRVTGMYFHDGSFRKYAYNTKGGMILAENRDTTLHFERDVFSRVIGEKGPDHAIQISFDHFGNRTSIASSLGAGITNRYDELGKLVEVSAGGWESSILYNEVGREIARLLPDGIRSEWERDRIGRPVKLLVRGSTEDGLDLRYKWDVQARLGKITDGILGETRFEHDPSGNLTRTIFPDGTGQLRNPDKVGNLFETEDRSDREYYKGGKLARSRRYHYSYDGEGNLVGKKAPNGDTWSYTWDAAGMLQSVTRPDGGQITFSYDALGRRISKRYRNTITRWVWDADKPLHEWKEHALTGDRLGNSTVDANGVITWIFSEESFAPQAKLKNGKSYSIICDHLGTPLQMYGEGGIKHWESRLDAYGKVRMFEGDIGSCPFRYQGQYEDVETGLYYNRFRYYDPGEGLYITRDPISLKGGLNVYGYVHDPCSEIDFFGLNCATVENGELEIEDKFPPGSKESLELRAFVAEWNRQIKAQGGSLTRSTVSKDARKAASKAAKSERIANPGSYAGGEVAGHTPDVGWGGSSQGPFVPLTPAVNSYVGGATQAVAPGTSYSSVTVVNK